MRLWMFYTFARLGVFAACLGIFWVVGLRDPLLLLLVAATVSMLLSLLFLAGLRDKFSADVANRIHERRSRRHGPGVSPPGATATPTVEASGPQPSEPKPAKQRRPVVFDDDIEDAEADSFR